MNDLEIYVRELDTARLEAWLAESLDGLAMVAVGSVGVAKGKGYYQGVPVRVSLYPGAFSKHFTSVVLEGDELPWRSDLDCARNAWRRLDVEVRCSPGDWKEGDPVQDEKWWRLDHRGEQMVNWN